MSKNPIAALGARIETQLHAQEARLKAAFTARTHKAATTVPFVLPDVVRHPGLATTPATLSATPSATSTTAATTPSALPSTTSANAAVIATGVSTPVMQTIAVGDAAHDASYAAALVGLARTVAPLAAPVSAPSAAQNANIAAAPVADATPAPIPMSFAERIAADMAASLRATAAPMSTAPVTVAVANVATASAASVSASMASTTNTGATSATVASTSAGNAAASVASAPVPDGAVRLADGTLQFGYAPTGGIVNVVVNKTPPVPATFGVGATFRRAGVTSDAPMTVTRVGDGVIFARPSFAGAGDENGEFAFVPNQVQLISPAPS